MRTPELFAAAAALSVAWAAPSPSTHALHEKRGNEASTWVKRSRVESSAILPMRIALAQQNLHKGYEWVMDVSDPKSANFGKHWTEEAVHEAFSPSQDTAHAIVEWLSENGISKDRVSHSDHKTWIAFDATAEEAEALFGTEFYEHEDPRSGRFSVASDEYYLPHHLVEHIDYIKPGVMHAKLKKRTAPVDLEKRWQFPGHKHGPPETYWQWPQSPSWWWNWQQHHHWQPGHGSIAPDLVNCSRYITPACVRALYDVPLPSKNPNPKNTIGVFEESDTYSQEDLDSYFATYSPQIPKGTHPIANFIDGAVAPVPVADAGGESMLDLTILYSLLYPQTVTLYQTDDPIYATESLNGTLNGFWDTFLDALDGSFCTYSAYGQTGDNNTAGMDPVYPDPQPGGYKGQLQCGVYKPANVISISYLGAEYGLPVNYQKRQCNEWMKLALRGHTILFASGDYGVASFPDANDPNGYCPNKNIFAPSVPDGCPFVTSVGATQLPINGTIYDDEIAVSAIFGNGAPYTSGGGFSNIFPIPGYQKAALEHYYRVSNPSYPYYETLDYENVGANGGIYNRIGRGFPDISANGRWWADYLNGAEVLYGGTSMATPIVASIINLLVEERLAIGKGPIGFLNPSLYANPWLTNDITKGHNLGCGTQGFNTSVGWDPVTGMGTPRYNEMRAYFLSLP